VVRNHRGDDQEECVRADDDLRRNVRHQALDDSGRFGETERRETDEGLEAAVTAQSPDRKSARKVEYEATPIQGAQLRFELGNVWRFGQKKQLIRSDPDAQ